MTKVAIPLYTRWAVFPCNSPMYSNRSKKYDTVWSCASSAPENICETGTGSIANINDSDIYLTDKHRNCVERSFSLSMTTHRQLSVVSLFVIDIPSTPSTTCQIYLFYVAHLLHSKQHDSASLRKTEPCNEQREVINKKAVLIILPKMEKQTTS